MHPQNICYFCIAIVFMCFLFSYFTIWLSSKLSAIKNLSKLQTEKLDQRIKLNIQTDKGCNTLPCMIRNKTKHHHSDHQATLFTSSFAIDKIYGMNNVNMFHNFNIVWTRDSHFLQVIETDIWPKILKWHCLSSCPDKAIWKWLHRKL